MSPWGCVGPAGWKTSFPGTLICLEAGPEAFDSGKTRGEIREVKELRTSLWNILNILFFLVQGEESKDDLAFVTEMTRDHAARVRSGTSNPVFRKDCAVSPTVFWVFVLRLALSHRWNWVWTWIFGLPASLLQVMGLQTCTTVPAICRLANPEL